MENLCKIACDLIEELIVKDELKPGQWISEKELSTSLAIGRSPVREAIKKLESRFLIRVMPRRGMYVSDLGIEEILKQFNVFSTFEELLLSRVVLYSSNVERESLLTFLSINIDAVASCDKEAIIEADKVLCEHLNNISGNEILKHSIEPYQVMVRRLYFKYYDSECPYIDKVNDSRINLINFVANGEYERYRNAFEVYKMSLSKLYYSKQLSSCEIKSLYSCG